jgi:hypothetical protein
MADDPQILPQIPEALRVAARQGTLVPFIGAGVSRLCGCPSWDQFANIALEFFVTEGVLNYSQLQQLYAIPNARVRLSIALGLQARYGRRIDFRRMLQTTNPDLRATGERVYGHIARLAPLVITTNYDEWADNAVAHAPDPNLASETDPLSSDQPPRRVLFRPSELTVASLSLKNAVIHIHGSVREPSTMVFSTRHYLERYAGHHVSSRGVSENPYLSFLEVLFRTKTVLFIGYGISELEILEYVIEKARGAPTSANQLPRHFLVEGFYSHQREVRREIEEYLLRECSIGLVPFSLDAKDHNQLEEVLLHLSREIPAGPLLVLERLREMEALLE